MAALRSELRGDMAAQRSELNGDMTSLGSELQKQMQGLKADLTWRFAALIVFFATVMTILNLVVN